MMSVEKEMWFDSQIDELKNRWAVFPINEIIAEGNFIPTTNFTNSRYVIFAKSVFQPPFHGIQCYNKVVSANQHLAQGHYENGLYNQFIRFRGLFYNDLRRFVTVFEFRHYLLMNMRFYSH